MLSGKGFAGHKGAAPYSGSAAGVTGASSIAATIAVAKHGGSNVELRICVIGELLKGDSTNGTVNSPIDDDWRQFPLWIKVPPSCLPLTKSSRRRFTHRLSPKMAANKPRKPE
ncbi:MAG: hypothetical protein LAP85_28010 [Acidobacteriia bacterium]|nr:hypothetical protein [Terriglobia bacterium]